jgi:hypothetical protein
MFGTKKRPLLISRKNLDSFAQPTTLLTFQDEAGSLLKPSQVFALES